MRSLPGPFILGLLCGPLLTSGPARAEEAPAADDSRAEGASAEASLASPRVEPSEQALGIQIELADTSLDTSSIQAALEKELGVPVRPTDQGERLRLRVEASSLDASYGDPKGRSVSRHIELPSDPGQQLELIALLTGNLVRDEAHSLLERLRQSQVATPNRPGAATAVAVAPPAPQPENKRPRAKPQRSPRSEMPASLTLFSPISTDPKLAEHEAHFDVGVAYSDIGRLNGMAVNAGILQVTDGGRGFQVAGIGSKTGPFEGMNVSGIYGIDGGTVGFSVAGIYQRHTAPSRGLSVSLINAQGGAPGAESENAFQQETRGAQIGLVNIGANLRGAQIGLVNVQTGSMRGAQIGLVNVSKDLHGAAIGLVNAGTNVRVQGLAWASMNPELDNPARQVGPMVHFGAKYRIQNFFSLVSFGVAAEADGCGTDPGCPSKDLLFAPAFGAGYSFPLSRAFALEVDGLYQIEFSPRGAANAHGTVASRVTAVWSLSKQVALFAGGGPRVILPNHNGEQVYYAPTFHAGIELF